MKFTAKFIEGWLTLTPEASAALGWKEGDIIEGEVCGDTLLAHKPIAEEGAHENPKHARRTHT